MSSLPASVLVVALELGRVTPSACGCNPNLSSTVHLIGDCRSTPTQSLPSLMIVPFQTPLSPELLNIPKTVGPGLMTFRTHRFLSSVSVTDFAPPHFHGPPFLAASDSNRRHTDQKKVRSLPVMFHDLNTGPACIFPVDLLLRNASRLNRLTVHSVTECPSRNHDTETRFLSSVSWVVVLSLPGFQIKQSVPRYLHPHHPLDFPQYAVYLVESTEISVGNRPLRRVLTPPTTSRFELPLARQGECRLRNSPRSSIFHGENCYDGAPWGHPKQTFIEL